MGKDRVVAFVDGFNMYHSLIGNGARKYKWLNYRSLSEKFVAPTVEELTDVLYFSALARWNAEKMEKHKTYMKALRGAGVKCVLGNFKQVTKKCRADCKKKYQTFEEKETDVNIAVHMVRMALQDMFDTAFLFSGDSDLIPAIEAIHEVAPHKSVKVIIPFGRKSEHLRKTCLGESARVKEKHLQTSLFPDQIIVDAAKGMSIDKPAGW